MHSTQRGTVDNYTVIIAADEPYLVIWGHCLSSFPLFLMVPHPPFLGLQAAVNRVRVQTFSISMPLLLVLPSVHEFVCVCMMVHCVMVHCVMVHCGSNVCVLCRYTVCMGVRCYICMGVRVDYVCMGVRVGCVICKYDVGVS